MLTGSAVCPLSALSPPLAAHSVAALRYRLHCGPVDLAPLVIRKARRFAWGPMEVTAFVLGASHALTLTLPNGESLTELLTCLPPDKEPNAKTTAREWPLPSVRGDEWRREFAEGGVCGTVCVQRFVLAPGADALRDDHDDSLHEPFALPKGDTAWTRIGWRVTNLRLFVETIHTYPEEAAGIRSRTCLWVPLSDDGGKKPN